MASTTMGQVAFKYFQHFSDDISGHVNKCVFLNIVWQMREHSEIVHHSGNQYFPNG